MITHYVYDKKCCNLKFGTVGLGYSRLQYGLEMKPNQLFEQVVCVKYQPLKTRLQGLEKADWSDV